VSGPNGGRGRRRRNARSSGTPIWTSPWRRGLPAKPVEDPVAAGAGAPAPLSDVLEGLLGTAGPWRAGLAIGELSRRWRDVVGDPLDRHTAPGRLDDLGVLSVRASSAAWATQIRFLAVQVAANANEVLARDAVREVRVSVDPGLAGRADGAPAGP